MGLRSFLHRLTAPSPSTSPVDGSVKLVCVVNQSLKMGKEKSLLRWVTLRCKPFWEPV